MEKFTKQEIETAKKVFESYQINQRNQPSYTYYLDLLLKPETKKIVIEIECNYPKEFPLDEHSIRAILNCGCSESGLDWKVTELPEVFSREDIDKIFDSKFSDNDYVDSFINKLLSERSKNDN